MQQLPQLDLLRVLKQLRLDFLAMLRPGEYEGPYRKGPDDGSVAGVDDGGLTFDCFDGKLTETTADWKSVDSDALPRRGSRRLVRPM